jgi:hypothetical protein
VDAGLVDQVAPRCYLLHNLGRAYAEERTHRYAYLERAA